MSEAAERYARAIFEVGQETGRLAQLADQVMTLARAYTQNDDLSSALNDPTLEEGARDKVLLAVASRVGASPEAVNAVRVLMRRGRLSELLAVAERLQELSDEHSGILRVGVISARPLSESYYKELARETEQATSRKVVLDKVVDASLIAGVVVRIGSHTIDGSLKGRLREFEQRLARAS